MDHTLDIKLDSDMAALLDALTGAGHATLLVGGAVRDALRGAPVRDFDVVTEATTEHVRSIARDASWCRRIYAVGERFGTLGVVLADGSIVEVSQLHGRGDSPAERFADDAAKRDLTVNAIGAWWPALLVDDPTDGTGDLAAHVLRAPGDPDARLESDPLRVLRLARFASQLRFDVDSATGRAAARHAWRLGAVSVERVRDELTKLLQGEDPVRGLEVARDSGALAVVLPEVAALDGLEQPSFHRYDALTHTFVAVSAAPDSPVMRWAALLHDVGKAPMRTIDDSGRIRFFRHAEEGALLAKDVVERLRMSNRDARAIVHLVRMHMRLGALDVGNVRAVDRAVRALDMHVHPGPHADLLVSAEDALELELADLSATAHADDVPAQRARLGAAIAASRERGTRAITRSPLSGRDLMQALALGEGPAVGVATRAIVSAIERGELRADDRRGAIAIARKALRR